MEELEFRRATSLILFWTNGTPYGQRCTSRDAIVLTADALTVLVCATEWSTAEAVLRRVRHLDGRYARLLVARLAAFGMLETRSVGEPEAAASDAHWAAWSPSAAFFHFSTKADKYLSNPLAIEPVLEAKARHTPPPRPTKRVRGGRILLPRPSKMGGLASALARRRTWRSFAATPVTLRELSTLLHWTWRVQAWARVPRQGRVALKTSPSAGARHPIEAYVLVRSVAGVTAGWHHYDADAHELVRLPGQATTPVLERYLPGQHYFAGCAALVVQTAVFAREMWRYEYPRAYRALLIDVGHLSQTFCLVATSLGLAPFSTMALADSPVEEDLGLDPLHEGVLYAVGVGRRMRGLPHPGFIKED